jgi:hypothetical protein
MATHIAIAIHNVPPRQMRQEWDKKLTAAGCSLPEDATAARPLAQNAWQKDARKTVAGDEITGLNLVGNRPPSRSVMPEWVFSNAMTAAVLEHEFPKLHTDPQQRAAASRWALVIYRFYRIQQTATEIAEDLTDDAGKKVTTGAVKQILVRAKAVGEAMFGLSA